ncbi:hypothetical protein E2C01_008243 [Portunus trituberculatus]|uniref:Uncharacterized protein n=1 Tax=Portunus trituberculatus TaxID=210409 RepID=A0A5B7D2L7_PORTR|nr:hypothetical protein [Portunus trituberculatus]
MPSPTAGQGESHVPLLFCRAASPSSPRPGGGGHRTSSLRAYIRPLASSAFDLLQSTANFI